MNDNFLLKKLREREELNALRSLKTSSGLIDFCSNDYLGIITNGLLHKSMNTNLRHGSTGSRLLSGNYLLIEETELFIASFHDCEAALIFNSGYDANVGLLSCVPQKGDTILYDYLCHASIRDGMRLSFAQSLSFKHNDVEDLRKKLSAATGQVFIVTESVFSMDGDMAPLQEIITLCEQHGCHLIVDEAHATGIIGKKGEGLTQHLQLHKNCFARVHTFGKALGAHGAVVCGSKLLRDYLINFARPFIYTTSLPEQSVAAIKNAYEVIQQLHHERQHLQQLVKDFQQLARNLPSQYNLLLSEAPVQGIVIPGNENVRRVAANLQSSGFDVRPILYPTVPKGSERLRIVLHSFNTSTEVNRLISLLANELIS
jgi:8-amino-7-oxononanoate synthase